MQSSVNAVFCFFGNTRVMLWPREDCVNVQMQQTELSFSNDAFTYTVWQRYIGLKYDAV